MEKAAAARQPPGSKAVSSRVISASPFDVVGVGCLTGLPLAR